MNSCLIIDDIDKVTREVLEEATTLDNPTYQQAIRANPRAKYALSPYIRYFTTEKTTGATIIDRGCLTNVLRIEPNATIIDERVLPRHKLDVTHSIRLRDYQEGNVEEIMRYPQGIIHLPTGYGKTMIAITLATRLKTNVLFLADRKDLMEQMLHDIKQYTDAEVGTLMNPKRFTVATVQTLHRRLKAKKVDPTFYGAVIVDECHKFVSKTNREVLGQLPAHYRYGLTGTLRRTDGQGEAIKFLFGDVLISREQKFEPPTIELVPFHGHIPMKEYAQVIDAQTENKERNALIAEIIQNTKRKLLVLVKRVNHAIELERLCEERGVSILRIDAKMPRKDLMATLRQGVPEGTVIIGTYALLATGVDIPELNTLLLAGDLKSDVLQEQAIGRILRLLADKKDPRVIDIQDLNNPILRSQAKRREKFYENKKWKLLRSHV